MSRLHLESQSLSSEFNDYVVGKTNLRILQEVEKNQRAITKKKESIKALTEKLNDLREEKAIPINNYNLERPNLFRKGRLSFSDEI